MDQGGSFRNADGAERCHLWGAELRGATGTSPLPSTAGRGAMHCGTQRHDWSVRQTSQKCSFTGMSRFHGGDGEIMDLKTPPGHERARGAERGRVRTLGALAASRTPTHPRFGLVGLFFGFFPVHLLQFATKIVGKNSRRNLGRLKLLQIAIYRSPILLRKGHDLQPSADCSPVPP